MTRLVDLYLHDPESTATLGHALGARLRRGDVVSVIGDLGAGKTYLTRAIAQGMGIRGDVTSPTFALIHEYRGDIPLFHIDPYRLQSPESLLDLGFEEYLERGGVTVIEWANLMAPLLPPDRLTLTLTLPTEQTSTFRHLTLEALGSRYECLLEALVALPEVAALHEPSRGT